MKVYESVGDTVNIGRSGEMVFFVYIFLFMTKDKKDDVIINHHLKTHGVIEKPISSMNLRLQKDNVQAIEVFSNFTHV